jgi:class 3 adenylate cyclase/tetratricopeptide (TPR) repeat protein
VLIMTSVRCAQCYQANARGAKFCNACGARLEAVCPTCDRANAPASRFCNECGAPLTDSAPAAAGSRFESPQAYTPKHLAEKILTSRRALEGERKQVTVMFADVRGSTELLADLDPEDARKLLDPILERMMEAVHRYEGTVNRVLGDGIMAIFGAPLAHEDHAVRACYAALAMQQEIRRHTQDARPGHEGQVQIRVGLNSGEVVVRGIGNNLHMDYSAVGKTTHLAARMEQLASPGSIRLTRNTLRLAEGFVQVMSLGPVPIKGIADLIEVFELTGTTMMRTRLQAAAVGGLTHFVGRDAELDQIRQAFERAASGHGQVVAVVGEPGVGKSRLFWEVLHSHRLKGWLVLESSSVSYGKTTPYLSVIDLLKAYFHIEAGEDGQNIGEKITGKLLALDEALRPLLPALHALLEAPVQDPAWQDLDLRQRRQQTVNALKRLLFRESQNLPLCIVLENLHWIDADTQAVLDGLIESLPTAQILLLLNYRPEYQHGWGNKTYYTQLRLDPLPPESAQKLLRSLIGEDHSLQPLQQLLIERTEGNPFFLEESVRALVETGALTGDRGAYWLTKTIDNIRVPVTVQAVLAARIDRLPPEEKTILQSAAVIGKDAPLALLQAILEMSEEALRVGLTRLQTAEFLYETALFPEIEYTFKHALTHDVAYGSLLLERRRALHAAIVGAFETVFPERVAEQVNWLAHHAFRGEVWGKAVKYLRDLTSTEQPCLDGFEARGPESVGHLWWIGDYERALTLGRRDLADPFGSFGLTVAQIFRLGQAYHSLGDYPRAIDFLRRNVAALEGDLLCEDCGMAAFPSVLSRSWLAWCHAERGEFGEGIALGKEGVQIAESANHSYSLIVAGFGLGGVYLLKGDLDSAIAVLERGLDLARVKNLTILFPFAASPLGFAYALSGRGAEAIPVLEQAIEEAISMKLMANHSLRVARLGQAHLLAGRVDAALPLAERSLQLAREHKERGHEAYALRLLGEIRSQTDPSETDNAIARYGGARAIAEELGMRPLMVHCGLGLSRLHRRTGNQQRAQECLTTALAMAREMDLRLPGGTLEGTEA